MKTAKTIASAWMTGWFLVMLYHFAYSLRAVLEFGAPVLTVAAFYIMFYFAIGFLPVLIAKKAWEWLK